MAEKDRIDIMSHSRAEDLASAEYPQWLWERLEHFQDMRFGMFIHWGPYCQWGCIESWPLVAEDKWARPDDLKCWTDRGRDLDRFRRDYWKLNETFNPVEFAPEEWAEAARKAGMKYLAFTTKHHDGFCMFDTKTTDYRVTHPSCPFHKHPRADIAREVFDAFRGRGMEIHCYFSKSDWHSPYYWDMTRPAPDRNPNYDTAAEPERWEKFVQFAHSQIRELMSDYGPMLSLWLDGGQVRPPKQDIRMDEIAANSRILQPGLLMVDRTVGGRNENVLTPEQEIPETPLGHPWESCLTMGNGWSYRPNDTYKPARKLIHMLVDIVAKGGNFLLNIGPDPMGHFDPEAMRRLGEIAAWMDVNGEAIHGTRAVAPYKEGNVCFTRKGAHAYAIILAEGNATAPPAKVALRGLRPAEGSEVYLLGGHAPLKWKPTANGAEIQLPPGEPPCEHAWTLRFRPA